MFSVYIAQKSNNPAVLSAYTPLHHPNMFSLGYVCIAPVLTEALNSAGSFEFSVAPDHPLYSNLHPRLTYVSVRKDNTEIWRGRVERVSRNFNNVKKVSCEGELSYLCDSIQQPFLFRGTVSSLFEFLLGNHNESPLGVNNDERRIVAGGVNVQSDFAVDILTTNAQNTFDCIRSLLLNVYGGCLRTRKSGNLVYLDYVDLDKLNESEIGQQIKFGENLIHFDELLEGSDIVTWLYPLGASKAHPPVLYKRNGSSNYFYRVTSDVTSGGKYLLVANGAAMNTTPINATERLSSTMLNSDVAEFGRNSNGEFVRIIETSILSSCMWTISQTTTPKDKVSLSGGGTSITGNNIDVQISGVAGGSSVGSIGGTQVQVTTDTSSAAISTTANDAWAISISVSGTTRYLAASGQNSDIAPLFTTSYSLSQIGKRGCWKISCNDSGATITNVYNSDNKVDAVIHGDVDNGFRLSQSANGSVQNELSASVGAQDSRAIWDGNRVTLQRSVASLVVTDIATNPQFIWGNIYGTKVFDSAESPDELYFAATNYLHSLVQEKTTFNVSAIDLSQINENIDAVVVGRKARIHSAPHNIDLSLFCTQKKTYLTQPDKTTATFGALPDNISSKIGG